MAEKGKKKKSKPAPYIPTNFGQAWPPLTPDERTRIQQMHAWSPSGYARNDLNIEGSIAGGDEGALVRTQPAYSGSRVQNQTLADTRNEAEQDVGKLHTRWRFADLPNANTDSMTGPTDPRRLDPHMAQQYDGFVMLPSGTRLLHNPWDKVTPNTYYYQERTTPVTRFAPGVTTGPSQYHIEAALPVLEEALRRGFQQQVLQHAKSAQGTHPDLGIFTPFDAGNLSSEDIKYGKAKTKADAVRKKKGGGAGALPMGGMGGGDSPQLQGNPFLNMDPSLLMQIPVDPSKEPKTVPAEPKGKDKPDNYIKGEGKKAGGGGASSQGGEMAFGGGGFQSPQFQAARPVGNQAGFMQMPAPNNGGHKGSILGTLAGIGMGAATGNWAPLASQVLGGAAGGAIGAATAPEGQIQQQQADQGQTTDQSQKSEQPQTGVQDINKTTPQAPAMGQMQVPPEVWQALVMQGFFGQPSVGSGGLGLGAMAQNPMMQQQMFGTPMRF